MSALPFDVAAPEEVAKYDPRTACGMALCRQSPVILFHAIRPCDHAPKRLDIGCCPRHRYVYEVGVACRQCGSQALLSEPISLGGAV